MRRMTERRRYREIQGDIGRYGAQDDREEEQQAAVVHHPPDVDGLREHGVALRPRVRPLDENGVRVSVRVRGYQP